MAHNTSRLALPVADPGDNISAFPAVDAATKAIVDGGVTVTQGTLAAIPAAGLAGRRYFATNIGVELYDTGSTWVSVGTPTPIGVVTHYAGAVDPVDSDGVTRWFIADGRVLNRSTYALLFSAISTSFGVGDGTTTFNIPDCRGKVSIGAGQGSGLTSRVVATTGGEDNHVVTASETPAHSHTGTSSGTTGPISADHTHSPRFEPNFAVFVGGVTNFGVLSGAGNVSSSGATGPGNTSHTHAYSVGFATASDHNGGAGHNNDQPYVALNHIIRVL